MILRQQEECSIGKPRGCALFQIAVSALLLKRRDPAFPGLLARVCAGTFSSAASQPFSINVSLATATLSTTRWNVPCPLWSSAENVSMLTPFAREPKQSQQVVQGGRRPVRQSASRCRTFSVAFLKEEPEKCCPLLFGSIRQADGEIVTRRGSSLLQT